MGAGRLERFSKTARALALGGAMALGLIALSPAATAGPFDVIRNLPVPSMPAPKPSASAPSANTNTPPPGAPMMVTAPTAQAPLHKLGTDAVAVIESSVGGAPVQVMDYVFAKQTLRLPPKAQVRMSYLSGCLSETFTGGTVTVGQKESTVAGGVRTQALRPGCKAPNPIILASASEAGATVSRLTPFSGVNWDERALHSQEPVFKWEAARGAVSKIRVRDLEKPGEPVIWEAQVDKDWIAYPSDAAKLVTGTPYRVEAVSGERVVAQALFSIDPALDDADTLASRLVPLAAS
jgi:hypothetical protein